MKQIKIIFIIILKNLSTLSIYMKKWEKNEMRFYLKVIYVVCFK